MRLLRASILAVAVFLCLASAVPQKRAETAPSEPEAAAAPATTKREVTLVSLCAANTDCPGGQVCCARQGASPICVAAQDCPAE